MRDRPFLEELLAGDLAPKTSSMDPALECPGAVEADSLSLSITDGQLTLGSTAGLTFTSGANNSASMTVTGTLANLNAALNGLVYTPKSGYSGPDSLQISVKDSGDNLTGSATVAIAVNPPPK
jgi:hypothetical protein